MLRVRTRVDGFFALQNACLSTSFGKGYGIPNW